jgi:TatD DNase family protein
MLGGPNRRSLTRVELIDIGANLTHEAFARDLASVLDHARAVGIVSIVVTGASAQGSREALVLARRWPRFLYATAGVHPHHAAEYTSETEELLTGLLKQPEVVAAGECGLDYYRDLAPRAAQQFAFERQLALAIDSRKPVFLHQRDAHADFLAILRAHRDWLGPCVVHCFTGTREELHDYLDLDCHIGITGWIADERRGLHLIEAVRDIPADRLMIETDAPYLIPRNIKPRPKTHRNEPRWLPFVLGAVASARGESPEQLAATSTATAREFFGIG